MRTRSLPILLAFATLAVCLRAQSPPGDDPPLLNAYLAQAAVETIRYRADPQPGGDPRNLPPGRLFGISPALGPFTYRPKTCDELTPAERAALIRNPEFRSFLIAARERGGPIIISIPSAEMLRPRPVVITLPAPPGGP